MRRGCSTWAVGSADASRTIVILQGEQEKIAIALHATRGLRLIQRNGFTNKRFESRLVDLLAFMDVDGAPHIALKT